MKELSSTKAKVVIKWWLKEDIFIDKEKDRKNDQRESDLKRKRY